MKHTLYALLHQLNTFPKYISVQKKQPMYKAVETRQPEDGRQYQYTSKLRNEPPKQTNKTQIYYGKKPPVKAPPYTEVQGK